LFQPEPPKLPADAKSSGAKRTELERPVRDETNFTHLRGMLVRFIVERMSRNENAAQTFDSSCLEYPAVFGLVQTT
jgi:hypothetical protein